MTWVNPIKVENKPYKGDRATSFKSTIKKNQKPKIKKSKNLENQKIINKN